ncbi:hypothetical protein OKW24_002634 [Peribacillus simplex]|nr:hypothetical protein [Peribacillus simplex]
MEDAIDFSFIYDLVKVRYSEVGRPSIDPVILVKLTFIQFIMFLIKWFENGEVKSYLAEGYIELEAYKDRLVERNIIFSSDLVT